MKQLPLKILPQLTDYPERFKKLYYHLYSNSSASRAETIISDLSKLLLVALSSQTQTIEPFISGMATANELLIPLLIKRFPKIVADNDKFAMDNASLRAGLLAINDLDLHSAPAHLLGDAFQALMGPRLRGDKGQFFTPKSVVRAMVEITAPGANAKVVDPACGTSGFLSETAFFWKNKKIKPGYLIGIDKDADLSLLSSALLEIVSPEKYRIYNQNSLDIKRLETECLFEADVVLTNPPFGAKIAIKENSILQQFALGHIWIFSKGKWIPTNDLRGSQDPQILFIELCIRLLKPGGKLAIVLPEGVFGNTNSGYIWDYIRSQGTIEALIDCPRTTFQPSTDTKTNILFFEKHQSNTIKRGLESTFVAVALNCGHDRRGKVHKNNDFECISREWWEGKKGKRSNGGCDVHFWNRCQITNPYYLVPRYYDKTTEKLLTQEAAPLHGKLISFSEMLDKGWITIRKGHEVGADAYGTGDIPFVRTSDIANFEISIDPTKSISQEVYEKYAVEQNLKSGDILMVVDGRYRIGRCAILNEFNYQCVVQSHLRIISVSSETPIESIELLYLLNLPSVQREIRSLVFIQSTLGALGKRIKEIKLPLPAKNDQWRATLSRFSQVIYERAKLLQMLKAFDSYEVEL
ncbi:hypothetical protein PN36_08350 [Candidatus Thiomargarita nelsonii]|uniref:Uncharacterized protein n=1 Tax=Candidatus Thiomargarita nelsonii TaxID=1003181 RepID=A0A0A6P8G7_9GAMM|nr:hypothetical protein PN36_08350 [Candidatus Thiomargarita nelsonii]